MEAGHLLNWCTEVTSPHCFSCSLLEGSEESVCTMCSNPVKLGDLLEVKDISSVLEASRSQETLV